MKTVYSFDSQGIFAGDVSLDESDISPFEPGVFLIPAGCTELAPPATGNGQAAVFISGEWVVRDDPRGRWYQSTGKAVDVTDLEYDTSGLVREPRPSAEHDLIDGAWELNQQRYRAAAENRLLQAVQSRIESTARARGYDSSTTITMRAGYPNPWREEALAFAQWMDGQYVACYSIQQAVLSGQRDIPSESELLAILPAMTWPA